MANVSPDGARQCEAAPAVGGISWPDDEITGRRPMRVAEMVPKGIRRSPVSHRRQTAGLISVRLCRPGPLQVASNRDHMNEHEGEY